MTDARRILIISVRPALSQGFRTVLEGEGYLVLTSRNTLHGLERLRQALPDLVIVDAASPDLDGPECIRSLRAIADVPILVLVPRLTSDLIARLLDLGADDCALADLPALEALARVRALLRRAEAPPLLPRTSLVIDADLTIDFSRAQVIAAGRPVKLRPSEYRLLYHLASNPGRVLPYESLLARVWGPEYQQETHYVRLYAAYLRQKIEPDPAHPRYILTERGLGYRFVDYRTPEEGRGSRGAEEARGRGTGERGSSWAEQ